MAYDKLVIGTGAEVNTFGIPGVKEHTSFLKTIGDARYVNFFVFSHFLNVKVDPPEDHHKL